MSVNLFNDPCVYPEGKNQRDHNKRNPQQMPSKYLQDSNFQLKQLPFGEDDIDHRSAHQFPK